MSAIRNSPELYECMLGDVPEQQPRLPRSNKSLAIANEDPLLEYTLRRRLPVLGECANSHSVDSLSHLPFLLNPLLRGEQVALITKDNSDGLWASLQCTFWLSPSLQLLQWTINSKEKVGVIPIKNIVECNVHSSAPRVILYEY